MTVAYPEHLALLREFLDRRQEIVEHIERRLLNVREKDTPRSRNRRDFEQILDSCFFGLPGLPRGLLRLKGQQHWERHRWPGRSIRLPFASSVYSVFILRQLEHLSPLTLGGFRLPLACVGSCSRWESSAPPMLD